MFTRSKISSFTTLEAHIKSMFSEIDAHGGAPFNIQPMLGSLTLAVAAEQLLGHPSGSVDARVQFGVKLDIAIRHATFSNLFGSLWWLWKPREYRDTRNSVREYVRDYAQAAIAGGGNTQFLRTLVEKGLGREEIVDQIIAVMTAGRDTTSILLGWAVWHLLRDRTALERLADEVRALGDVELTVEVLDGCKFLKAVINESKKPSLSFNGMADLTSQRFVLHPPCRWSAASRSCRSRFLMAAVMGARRCWLRNDRSFLWTTSLCTTARIFGATMPIALCRSDGWRRQIWIALPLAQHRPIYLHHPCNRIHGS